MPYCWLRLGTCGCAVPCVRRWLWGAGGILSAAALRWRSPTLLMGLQAACQLVLCYSLGSAMLGARACLRLLFMHCSEHHTCSGRGAPASNNSSQRQATFMMGMFFLSSADALRTLCHSHSQEEWAGCVATSSSFFWPHRGKAWVSFGACKTKLICARGSLCRCSLRLPQL